MLVANVLKFNLKKNELKLPCPYLFFVSKMFFKKKLVFWSSLYVEKRISSFTLPYFPVMTPWR